jgi:hypothetical protein
VGLAQERGQHRDHQQQQQPGYVHRQRHAQRHQGDHVLDRGEQQGADAPHRLAPGPLQLVVQLGVLELLQVERRRVAHQLHAGAIGEEVAEQALQQRRHPGETLAHHGDAQLARQQLAQPGPGHDAARCRQGDRVHHLVYDQLADPEHRERHQRAEHPEDQDPHHVPGLRLPHQLEQPGEMAEGLQPFLPRHLAVLRPAASAGVGADHGMLERQGHG